MKRKAQCNDVVAFTLPHAVQYGVVVEYRANTKWGRYRVIRTDPQGRSPYGPAIWLDSTELESTGKQSKRPGVVLRHNKRLGGDEVRGCSCNCCHHVRGVEDEPEE